MRNFSRVFKNHLFINNERNEYIDKIVDNDWVIISVPFRNRRRNCTL